MHKKVFTITILSVLLITGCTQSSSDKNIEQETKFYPDSPGVVYTDSTAINYPDSTVTIDTSILNKPFQKILSSQAISYNVISLGSASIQTLYVITKGLTEINDTFKIQTDGKVTNAEIADLNADGFPELLVYTTSAGSGSYGNVIGFSPNNGKSLSQVTFPNVADNPKANSGYMGHDSFAVVANNLVQKFPVYKKNDNNSKPTGGIRKIQYKLVNGEASRIFVVEKIEDLPKNNKK